MPNCNVPNNTAQNYCAFQFRNTTAMFIQRRFQDNGTANIFADLDSIDEAAIDLLISADTPADQRLFPIPNLILDEAPKPETIRQDLNNGVSQGLGQNPQIFNFSMSQVPPEYQEVLDSFAGGDYHIYLFDREGNMLYAENAAGEIVGLKLSPTYTATTYKLAMYTEGNMLYLELALDPTFRTSSIRWVEFETLGFNGNDKQGLIDIAEVLTAPGSDAITGTYTQKFYAKSPITGLLITDFSPYNVTQDIPLTPDSVIEGAPGVYTFDFTTEATALNVIATDLVELRGSLAGTEFEVNQIAFV